MELKRKEFKTYPVLQAKWTALAMAMTGFGCVLVYASLRHAVMKAAERNPEAFFSPEAAASLLQAPFLLAAAVAVIAAGAATLIQLHGLLGPLKALETALGRVRHGDLKHGFYVRQADEFQDLAADVRAMQQDLREAVLKDREKARALKAVVDQALADLPAGDAKARERLAFVSKELATLTGHFQA